MWVVYGVGTMPFLEIRVHDDHSSKYWNKKGLENKTIYGESIIPTCVLAVSLQGYMLSERVGTK